MIIKDESFLPVTRGRFCGEEGGWVKVSDTDSSEDEKEEGRLCPSCLQSLIPNCFAFFTK